MTFPITQSTTAAVTVLVDIKTESLVLVGASGIAGVEVVTVEVEDGLGGTPAVVQEDVALELSVTNNVVHLRGPGQYYLTKPTTAGAAHLFLYPPVRAEIDFREV